MTFEEWLAQDKDWQHASKHMSDKTRHIVTSWMREAWDIASHQTPDVRHNQPSVSQESSNE